MRLAPQLVLAFGFLTAVSTAGLGAVLRQELRHDETERFEKEVRSACKTVQNEVSRQAEGDRKLVAAACASGELVERSLTWIENGEIDNQRLSIQSTLVPNTRAAFDLDELLLATGEGEVLGADPLAQAGKPRREVAASLNADATTYALRVAPPVAIVSRCKTERGGRVGGLVGARHLVPVLRRLSETLEVTVVIGDTPKPPGDTAEATCAIKDSVGASIPILVAKSRAPLHVTLAYIDRVVLLAAAASTAAALLLAVLLARSLGRPIAELAAEARKVATEEATPLKVRGSGEIAELVRAFDRMIEDLAATRRRLAATSRVAAWREVARRVAHEVKNPLAPIRAAVETLRRLRARKDPAFDEYFDEATRTVLDEVHRISNIVTEFTRFARLPPPRPQDVDVGELVRQVIKLQEANAGGARLEHVTRGAVKPLRADRDQIVQVLTNLVQNAVEAVQGRDDGAVVVTVDGDGARALAITVADNGAGVSAEMATRLFEPYATSKPNGTGLGLAIAQRIAVDHGGELSLVKGASSRGATFRLTLPLDGPPPMSEMPPSSS